MVEQGYSIRSPSRKRQGGQEKPLDVDDFICWINKTRAEDYIHSVWLWLGGFTSAWELANLTGIMLKLHKFHHDYENVEQGEQEFPATTRVFSF